MLKDLAAILLRQIDVQDYQDGAGRGIVVVRTIEETSGRLAVFYDMNRGFDS
jgi:hypothetical protein